MHDSERRYFLGRVGRMLRASRAPKVFISYRRSDSSGYAGRLYDTLAAEFGAESVFIDVVDIAPGEAFPPKIEETIRSCDALVAVIGPRWLTPGEVVQTEIATALGGGVRVIPVLVDDAQMPARQDLPARVEKLYALHAIELSDSRWRYDTELLIRALRERRRPSTLRRRFPAYARAALATRRGRIAAAALLLAVAASCFAVARWDSVVRTWGSLVNPGPRDFADCVRQRLPAVPQERFKEMAAEAGDSYVLAGKDQPKEGPFVLRFTEFGRPLGALSISFFPNESSREGTFRIGRVIEPLCHEVEDYSNESRKGLDKHLLVNWDWLKVRFGKRYYWFRPGYNEGTVYAYFDSTGPAQARNTN